MNNTSTGQYLNKMFYARKIVLRAGVILLVLAIAAIMDDQYAHLLTERGLAVLVIIPMLITLFLIYVGVLVICYYIYRAGAQERGLGYAIGHLLLCAALSGVFLLGVILIPLLVRSDIEKQGCS